MQFSYLPNWLARAAAQTPDRLAIECGETRLSFAELDQRATQCARRLASAGARPGERIALLARNGADFATVVHAATRLGATLVPLNARLSVGELAWQVEDARASLLLADAPHAETARALRRQAPALATALLGAAGDDAAPALASLPESEVALREEIDLDAAQAIIYTSGTTGTPKGALITFGMQWWSATASALNLGLVRDDCWLLPLPFFHVGGLSTLMKSVIYAMPIRAFERFEPRAVNATLLAGRGTIISVVAVMLQRMLAALDEDAPSPDAGQVARYPATLRCVLLGGGPAPRPLLEDCARRGVPVAQSYGMTEACSQAATLAPEDALRKLGSAGRPLLPVQLRIMRGEAPGERAGVGEAGEIQLKGPTITPGYADRPEATARAFRDGWFATGDLGYLDAEGYLYVLDRRSDLIVSGGENVYPAELEAALLAHPDVEEAGVTGVPDAEWGQAPVAFVRLRAGGAADEEALLAFLALRVARYKLPRRVYLVGPLPRNAAGKLLRRELRGLLTPETERQP